MTISVGVIGNTGKTGNALVSLIKEENSFNLGKCFNKKSLHSLGEVFNENDYIVDFSNSALTESVLRAAISCPKPLVLCVTGFTENKLIANLIENLATKSCVVIAPNTSIGACLQRFLAEKIATLLDSEYDIDILEKHHCHKLDKPSGTAIDLVDSLKKKIKEKSIQVNSIRSGNLPGEHEVSFVSNFESISIKHTVFERILFAKGALKILHWLKSNHSYGIYKMTDVLGLKSNF